MAHSTTITPRDVLSRRSYTRAKKLLGSHGDTLPRQAMGAGKESAGT